MYREIVPPWVRHFTRRVIALAQIGQLDSREFGIYPRYATPADKRQAGLWIAYLAASMVALVLLADLAGEWLEMQECLFPPCY